jgi:drug/metabolite transporter (DMT)-like permease
MLFLDERLTPLQFVGGVFILLSTVLAIQRLGRVHPRLRWRFRPRA